VSLFCFTRIPFCLFFAARKAYAADCDVDIEILASQTKTKVAGSLQSSNWAR